MMTWLEWNWPTILVTLVVIYRMFLMKPPANARVDWKRRNVAQSLQLWAIFVAATILVPRLFTHGR